MPVVRRLSRTSKGFGRGLTAAPAACAPASPLPHTRATRWFAHSGSTKARDPQSVPRQYATEYREPPNP
eukprot:2103092-Pyramimonas_sp.AAC.1